MVGKASITRSGWKVVFLAAALVACSAGGARAQEAVALEETLRQARLLLAEGAYREAAEALEGVDAPAASYLLGQAYQGLLRHDRAVAAFLRADTTAPRVLAALGQSYDLLGRAGEAEEAFARAYRRDSANVRVATSLARLLAERRRWPAVAEIYGSLLGADPGNGYLHAQLATAYRALDSTDLAIVHYERARRLDPDYLRAVLQLSSLYLAQEHLHSAKRVIDDALDRHPRQATLWQRRGDIAFKEDDNAMAEKSFANALAYGDSSAAVLRNLGASRYLLGRFDDALPPLEASFRVDSTDGMTAFYLGMTHQQRGDHDTALHFLQRTTILMGQDMLAEVHAQIGATYDVMDRPPDAIRAYRLTLDLAPTKTEALFHLGALYDAYYADPSTALQHYERFLARLPDGQMLRLADHARRRITEIQEARFFQRGRSRTTPEDTSGRRR